MKWGGEHTLSDLDRFLRDLYCQPRLWQALQSQLPDCAVPWRDTLDWPEYWWQYPPRWN